MGHSQDTPAIVFLHGIGGSAAGWSPQDQAMQSAGFMPVALDMLGFGRRPPAESLSFEDLAADVEQGAGDLNGDGRVGSDLFTWDMSAAGAPSNTGLAVFALGAAHQSFFLIARSEFDTVSDLNGDGDQLDQFVLQVYDAATGTNTLVSAASGAPTTAGDGRSYDARLSGDGEWVTFVSLATNLVAGITDTGGFTDVFVWEAATGAQTLVSRSVVLAGRTGSSYSFHPEVSADGDWIIFGSSATDLVAGQIEPGAGTSNDVFLFDRANGTTRLVSHAPASAVSAADGSSEDSVLSADGRFVAYRSFASDLVTGDANGAVDVYRWDRDTDTTLLVSRVAGGGPLTAANAGSDQPVVSGDGRFVAFRAQALAPDQNDLFCAPLRPGPWPDGRRPVARVSGPLIPADQGCPHGSNTSSIRALSRRESSWWIIDRRPGNG